VRDSSLCLLRAAAGIFLWTCVPLRDLSWQNGEKKTRVAVISLFFAGVFFFTASSQLGEVYKIIKSGIQQLKLMDSDR
jgi:hypothetical protein